MSATKRPAIKREWTDDPLDIAIARCGIFAAISADLKGRASSGVPLSAKDEKRFREAFDVIQPDLKWTDLRVGQLTDPGQMPEHNYLLSDTPSRYPQADVVTNCVWYATELLRLAENIDRRLAPYREARAAEKRYKVIKDADQPKTKSLAATQVRNMQPIKELVDNGDLPGTAALLKKIAQESRQGKLQKSPRAIAAALRSLESEGFPAQANNAEANLPASAERGRQRHRRPSDPSRAHSVPERLVSRSPVRR